MEITVLVTTDYNHLHTELIKNNFEIKEEYEVKDEYMINNNIDFKELSNLEILKKCILIRDIVNVKKVLLYKNKEYDKKGNILKQRKIECQIINIEEAISFMKSINYKSLFKIYDKCVVYANDKTELVVQMVNNKFVFIEMESTPTYVNKTYNSTIELKRELEKYDIPYDKGNYFVKKAELMLKEILEDKYVK